MLTLLSISVSVSIQHTPIHLMKPLRDCQNSIRCMLQVSLLLQFGMNISSTRKNPLFVPYKYIMEAGTYWCCWNANSLLYYIILQDLLTRHIMLHLHGWINPFLIQIYHFSVNTFDSTKDDSDCETLDILASIRKYWLAFTSLINFTMMCSTCLSLNLVD